MELRTFQMIITADVHFERLEPDMVPNITSWIQEEIQRIRPDLFVIAGDTVDSRNLRAETPEYLSLVHFLQQICTTCEETGTVFVILRGTPSHDGAVVENIHRTILPQILYIDTLCVKQLRGKKILFIPELYYPKLEDFQKDLQKLLGEEKADLIVFHGMLDFALPAVQQIDSKFNQSRCIVMDSEKLATRTKTIGIGGHVHSFFGNGPFWYTGRLINERGHVPEEHTGMRLVRIPQDKAHEIHSLDNPYTIPMMRIDLDCIHQSLEQLLAISEPRRKLLEETTFVAHTSTQESRERYQQWKQIVQPIYVRQKKHKETQDVTLERVSRVDDHSISIRDLLQKLYQAKYGSPIPDETMTLIEGGTERG